MSFYKVMRGIVRALAEPYFLCPKVIHREKIHAADVGSVMVVCNHRTDYDPVLVGLYVNNREIQFMAKKPLFQNKLFGWFLTKLCAFPVDRQGNDLSAVKRAIKILKEGNVLGIFPEGQRNKSADTLLPFMDGAGLIAHKTQPIVLPVAIKNTNYGFLKRPVMEVGDPIDFTEEYQQKGSQELYHAMSEKMQKTILELIQK